MREVFASVLPDTRPGGATAEQLPFADQSFDAVTVAQAFHWFDAPAALAEFARVLRPGGGLALVWNERDESDPVVAELTRISKWDVHQPYPVGMDFGPVIDASGALRPGDPHPVPLHPGSSTARPSSSRWRRAATSPSCPRTGARAILDDVAALAARLDEPIPLPYTADIFCARVA